VRREILVVGLLLIAVVSLFPGGSRIPVQAAPLKLDEGENRQCPPGKPYYVTGLVQHGKRGGLAGGPSVRFHTRLANETVQPHVVIDEALTGANGRFKLCFGDGDVPAGGATRTVRAFPVYTPQTAPVIEVRRIDSASTDFVALYYSTYRDTTFLRQNFDLGLSVPVDGSEVEMSFRIKDDFQAGYDRVSGATGRVEAWFPSDPLLGSRFCYPAAGCTRTRIELILEHGRDSPFIVLHEMGHSVMFYRYNEALPTPPPNCPFVPVGSQTCQVSVWVQDWADFWAMAIRDNPLHSSGWDLDVPPGWPNGDTTSGRVAGALWDMYDLNPETAGTGVLHPDFYVGGLTPIWNLLTTPLANTFLEYWTRWKNAGNDRCASTAVRQ
jgi:hypothetical protein